MRKVNQFENNSVAPGRIRNVEMSNGSSHFWGGVARLTEAYSRMHMETAEKKYLAGLDLLKNEEINQLEQANPNDPDALREQLAAAKNKIASSISSDEIRFHFETGFDMQSITPINRAMAGKQAILDAEFETTLQADITAQRDMSMKSIPDVLKGDPSALINIRNANVRIAEIFNATHADGRPVFSPETRANAQARINDDFYADYAIALVKNSKNPAQAIKQFKNGAVALDFPNDDGSFENVNVRGAMSYDAAQRVDGVLDAYMKQLEAEARMRRLELMATMSDLTAQAMINQDASQVRALGNRIGGAEGANILRKADAMDYGFSLYKNVEGMVSFADKRQFLADEGQNIKARAGAGGDITGLEYMLDGHNTALKMLDAEQKAAMQDPVAYTYNAFNKRFNAINAAAGVSGINLPSFSENSIGANREAQQMIFGKNAIVTRVLSNEQIKAVQTQLGNAVDSRAEFDILNGIFSAAGGYAPDVAAELNINPAIVTMISTAKIDPQSENFILGLYAASKVPDSALPDNPFSKEEFRDAWNRNPAWQAKSALAAANPGNQAYTDSAIGLRKALEKKSILDGNLDAFNFKGETGVVSDRVTATAPAYLNLSPRALERTLTAGLLENHKDEIVSMYAKNAFAGANYINSKITERIGQEVYNGLQVVSAPSGQPFYYVLNPVSGRPVALKNIGPLVMHQDELLTRAAELRIDLTDRNSRRDLQFGLTPNLTERDTRIAAEEERLESLYGL